MTSDPRAIIDSAVQDSKVNDIIRRFGFSRVRGKSFSYRPNLPPAFTIGNSLSGGVIYVSDWVISKFDDMELEWVVLHELAHIEKNHIPMRAVYDLLSMGGTDYLAYAYNIPFLGASTLVKSLRSLVTVFTGGITANHEKEADRWASEIQGTKKHGITALLKLSRGQLDMISHVSEGFEFSVAALTMRQRIQALAK